MLRAAARLARAGSAAVSAAAGLLMLVLLDGAYVLNINRRLRVSVKLAEQASEAKTQFLSTMSHDIRTPLNAVIGMTQLAQDHSDDPAYVADCLNKISVSGNHLLTLINDILELSRVESGKTTITPAPFSVEEDMNRRLEGFEAGCDGRELIAAMVDAGSVMEFGKGYTDAVTALGKMAGRTTAFVYTGKGDTCDKRMKKIARFVRFADCYNIPVVSLVDSTGLKLFDTIERQMSVMNAASTLVYAYSEATTVKVTLVIGNAIGSAYVAMGGSANADMTYAWPGSVISPMTGEAAIQIMWKDKIMASKGDAVKAREELAAQYEAEVADGVNAAVEGLVDDVIDPADSRKMVIAALEILSSKRDSNPPKKHGNMPL